MRLQLTIFLVCLIIAAIGIGIWVDATTKVPVHTLTPGNPIVYKSSGAGWGAGLTVFGLGAAIGIPLILRRKTT